jgi:hypothetical protein
VLIPERLLIVGSAFGSKLDAIAVCKAIAQGVQDAGQPAPDVCPIVVAGEPGEDPRVLLDELGFDTRMRRARAVVVAWNELLESALAGSIPFELATRARQGGVPCYAVTRRNLLERFDARILDLQAVIEASSARALVGAGAQLAYLGRVRGGRLGRTA